MRVRYNQSMILDNENASPKVCEWIEKYNEVGDLSLVTGYFTVGALAHLAKITGGKTNAYKIVLGDIVSSVDEKVRALDLLNENIGVDSALKLNKLARKAVAFLELSQVEMKTLEPNFCHAKVFLQQVASQDPQKNYYISGSSNLTEAGMGLKKTNNIELNVAGFGAETQYHDLLKWFDDLWKRPQAHAEKSIVDENGVQKKVPFKRYLIDEIKKIFREYSPHEIYYKILFELFGQGLLLEQEDSGLNRKIGRLENTAIYHALFEFQQKGVLSLIKMLEKHNGAILADAVGLGKTWSALAVMKFYQLQGREIIVLCPKKLQYNWQMYQKHQNSRFEKDGLEFFLRFHTDLSAEQMHKYHDRADKTFVSDKPKLFVIDESHNLRNDKSLRYGFFLNDILAQNDDVKVLMLSATPINNTLLDIRNQYKLLAGGNDGGFEEILGVRSLEAVFRQAQAAFNAWSRSPQPLLAEFIKQLPAGFFSLTDALTVARTRKMIEGHQNGLEFPEKVSPRNLFITPREIGDFQNFEELFEAFPPTLSGYAPSFYAPQQKNVDVMHDEQRRDFFLIKMMYILLVKRLESSWHSFHCTVEKILAHHQNAVQRIDDYNAAKVTSQNAAQNTADTASTRDQQELESIANDDDELAQLLESFTLGKKRSVKLSDIDAAGRLATYRNDLQQDIEHLQRLQKNLKIFAAHIEGESAASSRDLKLQELIALIEAKQQSGENDGNRKVLIFTVYRDTALYLFEQLKKRGFTKLAMVSGDGSRVWNEPQETKRYEPILERFAPFTKLFREKEWSFEASPNSSPHSEYSQWRDWIENHDAVTHAKLDGELEILIATDALSEGQNLQDCDTVVNYDIHWNPVRVIQHMGRIDRLGSPNEKIFGVNFWPTENINTYLNLQKRIEGRMAAMRLAGAEVPADFTKTFTEMAHDEALDQQQKARMMEQMQVTWDDIETGDQNLGFDNLSLETFRQDLLEELRAQQNFYRAMPNGVYSGCRTSPAACAKSGLIALLGHPRRPPKSTDFAYRQFELLYLDTNGKAVFGNQKEILDALAAHKNAPRVVPSEVDLGEGDAVKNLAAILTGWFGEEAGAAGADLLDGIKSGQKGALTTLKDAPPAEKFKKQDFDLITWLVVSA